MLRVALIRGAFLVGVAATEAFALAAPAAARTQMGEWPLVVNTVLLPAPVLPDAKDVVGRLKTADLTFLQGATVRAEDQPKDQQLSIELGEGRFAQIGLMPKPVPGIRESCKLVWHWKAACDAADRTAAHAIVIVQAQGLSRVEGALLAARVLGAFAAAANATAVNWGIDFHAPAEFERIANNGSVDKPPAFLWVRVGIASSADGRTSLYTDGLELFEKRDIEVIDVQSASGRLIEFLLSMAFYSITSPREIRPGETVGRSNVERIPVTLEESRFFPGKRVLRFGVKNEFATR